MRLASYNLENLFDRPKVMNLDSWAEGREGLNDYKLLATLLGQETYTEANKVAMADLMIKLGLEKSDQGPFVILRRNKGKLLRRPKTGGLEIIADRRADWAGSLELIEEPINEVAMQNTARVIADVDADVLCVVEAESRPVLAEFNRAVLHAIGGMRYHHIMLIDGNDERGIDVGYMSKQDYPVRNMCSHVDDVLPDGTRIFSRDCPEYWIETQSGNRLIVMINHFKSKGYGLPAQSNARRKAQAQRVKEIYDLRRSEGHNLIAVVGDLNDTPKNDPLSPLVSNTDLQDVFTLEEFDNGGYPGTFGPCSESNRFDYIFLSPDLVSKVQAGGLNRKGMWPGKKKPKWEIFSELTREEEVGSDHAAVWVDVDI